MKKLRFIFLVIVIVFSFFMTIQAQNEEKAPDQEIPEGYSFYQYQYGFLDISIAFPENWINYSSQERGIMIYTPDSKGALLLIAAPMFGEEYTLEELWTLNMENLKLAGAVFQESTSDTFSGYPAIKALHTIKLGNDTHQYIRYSSIIGDLFYTFSFHAPVVDFEKYLEEVLTVVRFISIKIKE